MIPKFAVRVNPFMKINIHGESQVSYRILTDFGGTMLDNHHKKCYKGERILDRSAAMSRPQDSSRRLSSMPFGAVKEGK